MINLNLVACKRVIKSSSKYIHPSIIILEVITSIQLFIFVAYLKKQYVKTMHKPNEV